MTDAERKIEELKSRRFWGKLTVSTTYSFKAGEVYHVLEGMAQEESKIPKNGKESHGND
jgi:hypothetical protein